MKLKSFGKIAVVLALGASLVACGGNKRKMPLQMLVEQMKESLLEQLTLYQENKVQVQDQPSLN